MTSMREVAERAGVSKATVSNTLNRPAVVLPETRARVLAAIEELGFIPNEPARQLSRASSQVIGLVTIDAANPFFTAIASAIEEVTSEAGCAMILCNSARSPDKESTFLRMLAGHRVRGVILTPVGDHVGDREWARSVPVPVVLLDHPGGPDDCSVTVDDVEGGRLAARHLLELGHRRLSFLGGPADVRQHADRLEGARKAVREAGEDPERVLAVQFADGIDIAAGAGAASQILSDDRGPTGVLCGNDLLAFGAYRRLIQAGIRVPDDVAIVGYDDNEFAADWIVPLTSVRQPTAELGHTAARLLFAHASGEREHVHEQIVLQPELIVRQSTLGSSATR